MEIRHIPRSDNPSISPSAIMGRIALQLQGHRYELRVPRLFGAFDLVSNPMTAGSFDTPTFNVMDAIWALPQEVREATGPEECGRVLSVFNLVRETMQGIEAAHGRPWVRETKADLAESTAQLLNSEPSLGESRWASLLASERGLKAFIVTRGQRASHTHRLIELAEAAEGQGLVELPRQWIDAVQCSDSVLEGHDTGDLAEALRAQECAFEIVRHSIVGIPRF
jgi:hypothetical protein